MRPHKSNSQLASPRTLNMLNVVLVPVAALVGDAFALVRWRVSEAEAEIWGKKSALATLTAA